MEASLGDCLAVGEQKVAEVRWESNVVTIVSAEADLFDVWNVQAGFGLVGSFCYYWTHE